MQERIPTENLAIPVDVLLGAQLNWQLIMNASAH
jgi:hypothetical protein